MLIAASASALLLATAPGWGRGNERTVRRRTDAGREVRIYTYVSHRPGCLPDTAPRITIDSSPAHGTVALRPASVTVGEEVGREECIGKTLPGLGVFYTPTPGFRGRDTFDYRVYVGSRTLHDTARVRVR